MNGEDVVIGGRYVVGPEPTYRVGSAIRPSALCEGEVVTAADGPDEDGDMLVENELGNLYDVAPNHLTPYVEPDAAGDESAHDTLLKRAEKAEADLELMNVRADKHDGLLRDTKTELEEAEDRAEKAEEALRGSRETATRLNDEAQKIAEQRDEARATKDMHKERADDLEAALTKAEAEVRRLQDEHQNHNEAWAALSDDYEKRCAELDQLRAAPQLPADLPVVESVELEPHGLGRVRFVGGGYRMVRAEDAPELAAASLAVLAAEAAKPDPVEELARALHAEDDQNHEPWDHLSSRELSTYRRMARTAIAWTEKRDA